MRGLQGVGGLTDNVGRDHGMERHFALERGGQCFAVHELHREIDESLVRFAEVENRCDVRVRDLAGVLGLAREPLQSFRVTDQRRAHDLDRALALHSHMFGQIHLTHATFAQVRDHTITPADHMTDEVRLSSGRHESRAVFRAEGNRAVVLFPTLGAHLASVHDWRT